MHAKILKLLLILVLLALSAPVQAGEEPALFVVHFATGPNWQTDLPPGEQAGFQEHSTNLQRLRGEGRILFGARYGELGMIFLSAASLEAATAELDSDPGVQAQIFTYQIQPLRVFYPWQAE